MMAQGDHVDGGRGTRKVLVLGSGPGAFLAAIRSLGRAGIEIHIAWHKDGEYATKSRYIAAVHDIPRPSASDSSWITVFRSLMQRERFDLVLPTDDVSDASLQSHRAELEPAGRIYLVDPTAYEIVSDKIRTNQWAREVGVRVPRECVVTEPSQGEAPLSEFGLPIVLKPQASWAAVRPTERRSVRRASTRVEFDSALAEMCGLGPVAIQEFFQGVGTGVELLLHEGVPLLVFQHRRVHEWIYGGASTYRMSTPVNAALLDASLRLLGPLRYTGVAMVEFKVNPRTGEWVLIEVNGRFWGSLPLAISAGADFPLALYRLLIEGNRDVSSIYRVNLYCRNLRADLLWQGQNFRADRTDPTLRTSPLPTVVWETLKNIGLLRDRIDTFARDDPRPAWFELKWIARRFLERCHLEIRSRLYRFGPLRRLLFGRALIALRQSNRVLFVCKGNICRSPFAEQLARRLVGVSGHVEFFSAGYFPQSGRSSPENAIASASQWGIDLAPHRSRVLDEALVRSSDIILVFDWENVERVTAAYPFAAKKIHLLGALQTDGPIVIADPWGCGAESFHECYKYVAAILRESLQLLGVQLPESSECSAGR